MSNLSPAAQLEAKAHREQSKLIKAHEELKRVGITIKNSELPGNIKLRLYAALRAESDMIQDQHDRLSGFRKGAEISRGRQWVTQSE